MSTLRGARILTVTPPERWLDGVPVDVDGEALLLRWAATPEERKWTVNGSPLAQACTG
jgi:hypothetical protein